MFDLSTWAISDTHFRHKNIIKYCDRPMNHDTIMEENWVDLVAPGDKILHLGDVQTWFGDTQGASDILSNLPGEKYLILGNHDKLERKYYEDHGFRIINPFVQKFGKKRVLFSHYPQMDAMGWDINVHGHIHNNPYPVGTNEFKDYRNISVEIVGYKPVTLDSILNGSSYVGVKQAGIETVDHRKR